MSSLSLQYVKRRGTCVGCKNKGGGSDGKGLITKGELYWLKEGPRFPLKFHFDCFYKGNKWSADKITPGFQASIDALKLRDQARALACFEGTESQCATILASAPAEEESNDADDGQAPPAKKRKAAAPVDIREFDWSALKASGGLKKLSVATLKA